LQLVLDKNDKEIYKSALYDIVIADVQSILTYSAKQKITRIFVKDDEIYYDKIFDNRTHQTSNEIHYDEIYSNEICCDEVSSKNIIIINFSEDEDDNTNQEIFVEDDEEVLIFATN
ncbi:6361_t:CDS:2, partial [Cetraspora pellucida]